MNYLEIIDTQFRSKKNNRLLIQKIKNDKIYNELFNLYPFCKTMVDIIYCLRNNINEMPKCRICYNLCNYPNKEYCSRTCSQRNGLGKHHGLGIKKSEEHRLKNSLSHKGKSPPPLKESSKKKISLANSGKGNGMYGVKMSIEDKIYRSNYMKEKILSGEFTPKGGNRYTHFSSEYNGKKFRSSWEAAFYSTNTTLIYEKIRIPYYDSLIKTNRVYISDFLDEENRIIYEVRPQRLFDKQSDKFSCVIKWCHDNNYKFMHINEQILKQLKDDIDWEKLDYKSIKNLKRALNIT
jgi:hypothetical protein